VSAVESILSVLGFFPGPLWPWDIEQGKPEEPRAPRHQRPHRPLPTSISVWDALRAVATPEERAILSDAEDEDACHEMMIWEAGRIHGPEGLTAAALVLELTLGAIEEGRTPAWWDPEEHRPEVALSAMRAAPKAEALRRESQAAVARQQRDILAAPDADPAWRAYDDERATYPARLAAWEAMRTRKAQEITGYATREEHARALYGLGRGDIDRAVRCARGGGQ